MSESSKKNHKLFIGGILFFAVLSILPIWWNGIPLSADTFHHNQVASTLYQSIVSGEIYPNWAHLENAGYGGVVLRFYPPLAHYILSLGKILTGNWYDASCFAFVFWMFLSGLGVYFWANEFSSKSSAFLAACFYIFAPYHILQIYGVFLYSEFAGSAVLPFCFLFITRICRGGRLLEMLGLAVSLAVLIFTHLPLTIIGGICFSVYALSFYNRQNFLDLSVKLGIAILLGLSASSFQWIKILTEMNFVDHSSAKHFSGIYDFRQNFVFSFPYLWKEDERSLMFADFSVLMIFLCSLPLAFIFFKYATSEKRQELRGVLILAIFTIFMSTPLSLPIWENFGLLQKVQFPWRWISLVSMSCLIFAAAGFEDFLRLAKQKSFRPFTLLIIGGVLIGFAFTFGQIMRQAVYVPKTEFLQNNSGLEKASTLEGYLPIWAKLEAQKVTEKVLAENRQVEIVSWNPREKVFRVSSGEATKARLALYYYPLWQAEIDGVSTEISPAPDGAISIEIPPNETLVKVRFVESPIVKTAFWVTLLSWILLLTSSIFGFIKLTVPLRVNTDEHRFFMSN